jgi:hypothetical protein
MWRRVLYGPSRLCALTDDGPADGHRPSRPQASPQGSTAFAALVALRHLWFRCGPVANGVRIAASIDLTKSLLLAVVSGSAVV